MTDSVVVDGVEYVPADSDATRLKLIDARNEVTRLRIELASAGTMNHIAVERAKAAEDVLAELVGVIQQKSCGNPNCSNCVCIVLRKAKNLLEPQG